MNRIHWCALAYACCALVSLSSSACGESDEELPPGVAARVADRTVSTSALDRAAIGAIAIEHSAATVPPYWPVDVEGCMASKRKTQASSVSAQRLRERCNAERKRARAHALSLLIQGRWYELEARRRGIEIPTTTKQADFAANHARTDSKNLVDVARIYTLRLQLGPKPTSIPTEFSPKEIERYFTVHRKRYYTGSQRFVEALVAPTKPLANEVADAFRRGQQLPEVARRYRAEGVTRPYAGHLQNTIATGRKALQRKALPLDRGDVGIVEDPQGWYVFRVGATLPPSLRRSRTTGRASSRTCRGSATNRLSPDSTQD